MQDGVTNMDLSDILQLANSKYLEEKCTASAAWYHGSSSIAIKAIKDVLVKKIWFKLIIG